MDFSFSFSVNLIFADDGAFEQLLQVPPVFAVMVQPRLFLTLQLIIPAESRRIVYFTQKKEITVIKGMSSN